ncbi:hypothetical protein ACIQMJ_08540 [Actinosynnema sp. NPDC091369]
MSRERLPESPAGHDHGTAHRGGDGVAAVGHSGDDAPVAHVQRLQRAAGNRAVAQRFAGAEAAARAVVQRDPPNGGAPAPAPTASAQALDAASAQALTSAGVQLGDDDRAALAQAFPHGLTLGPAQPVVLGLRFGMRLDGYRMTSFQVRPATGGPASAVEAFLFQLPTKGRAILVSSIGGRSVQLDAGTGVTTSVSAPSVQRLVQAVGAVTSGPAAVPERVLVSHADTDHYNAVRALMQQAAFSNTAVEVAQQQLRTAESGAWKVAGLTVQPTQQLVEITVVGAAGGVHVQRRVVDNMELIEYRSVDAHSDLMRSGTSTYNRNRSSPVVVVHDLVSGERMVFTADAEGRQFTEIVNAIGADAFRRVLGGPGGNLRVMEAPHHFGEQAGADNTAGFLRMLEMAYEAGGDALRLVAQTTASFASTGSRAGSRTYNFLDTAGLSPEMVQGDPSPAGSGRTQVTRARGRALDRVTVDTAGVQQALDAIQRSDTPLRRAYGMLGECIGLRADAEATRTALGSAGAPAALTSSVTATEAALRAHETTLRAATARFWAELHTAANAAGGVNGSADLTQAVAELTRISAQVSAIRAGIDQARNDLEGHTRAMSLYSRLYLNSIQLVAALEAENIGQLYRHRAEHIDLVRAARGVLGASAVAEHVRGAWEAVRVDWMPRLEEFTRQSSARIAARHRSAEFRAVLAESLTRQMELNEVVARAEHAGRTAYRPDGTVYTPVSTRVGAGILAAIEVVRIVLEVAQQVRAGQEAAEERAVRSSRLGVATMNWWLARGVTPQLALVSRSAWSGYNRVPVADQAVIRQAAASSTRPAGVPEFEAVVVTGMPGADLRRLLLRMIAELTSLADWHQFNGGCPSGPAFRRFDNGWGVRVWSFEEDRYGYTRLDDVEPGLGAELDRLHQHLEAGQQTTLDEAVLAAGPGQVRTARDTALWGSDREVLVYNQAGNLTSVDFDSVPPHLLHRGTADWPPNARGPLESVRAADLPTYRRLAQFYWVRRTGSTSMDRNGQVSDDLVVELNTEGRAYVRPGELVLLAGTDPHDEARRRDQAARPPR